MTNQKTILNIRNVTFQSIESSSISYNTETARCENKKATSVTTKCSVHSPLVNLNTIESFSLSPLGLDGYDTRVTISIDTGFVVDASYLPSNQVRQLSAAA